MHDGSRGLTWPLYRKFNVWFIELGTKEGLFAAAYSTCTMVLACRGDSTAMICTKHLQWSGDAIAISFSHSKDEQLGDDPTKRLPRHCYCNPFRHDSDFASNMFNYLAMHPQVLQYPDGLVFPGDSTDRFSDVIKKIRITHKEEIEREYGFDIRDIGVHSWRKCAHTKMNCGSTASPSNAATNIRAGHSNGSVRSVYIVQEKASDQYCGRILSDLPEHSAEFAVSYPDFIPIDTVQSLVVGVTDADYETRKQQVNARVRLVLDEIFGREVLDRFCVILRFLVIGLASHLKHREKFDSSLPRSSPFRCTPLFTSSSVIPLKEHVRIAMPCDDHYKYFSDATGLPPHVIAYQYHKETQEMISGLPGIFEIMLDDRQFNGQISLSQMQNLIQNGPLMQDIARDIAAVKRLVTEESSNANRATGRITLADNQARQYQHSDGKLRRVPEGWVFPHFTLMQAYVYWHCGDEQSENQVCPMKLFAARDVSHLRRGRLNLSDLRYLMSLIDEKTTAVGMPPQDVMTRSEANSCFFSGLDGIGISSTTPTGKRRDVVNLTWSSVLRLMTNKKRK